MDEWMYYFLILKKKWMYEWNYFNFLLVFFLQYHGDVSMNEIYFDFFLMLYEWMHDYILLIF